MKQKATRKKLVMHWKASTRPNCMENPGWTALVATNAAGNQSKLMKTKSMCLLLQTAPFAGVQRARVSGSWLRLIPDRSWKCQTQQLGEALLLEKYLFLHLRCSCSLTVQTVSQEAELSLHQQTGAETADGGGAEAGAEGDHREGSTLTHSVN